jgi:integrase/recombinase XerD
VESSPIPVQIIKSRIRAAKPGYSQYTVLAPIPAALRPTLNSIVMRKLILTNASFEYLEKGFGEWLDVLGYSQMMVYNMPNQLREFLHFLEKKGVRHINQLEQKQIKSYYQYISTRPNQRRGGGLSEKYILMQIQTIEKFLEYLHHRGMQNLPTVGMRLKAPQRSRIIFLTVEEINNLFATTRKEIEHQPNSKYRNLQESMGARDRAMLAVYYSCGLRRNEGVHLQVEDINLDTKILHVKKGKGYKERFVPFNKTNAKLFEEYIYEHRPQLLKTRNETNLFISANNGKPMDGSTLYYRLKQLQILSDDIGLQQKEIGLHTLRHSIATHLLEAGMPLEKIARFLGHSTIDSTQIYTHLIEKKE